MRDRNIRQTPDETVTSSGYVDDTTQQGAAPASVDSSAGKMSVPSFATGPGPAEDLSDYINTPLAQLPAYQRAVDARNKLIALEAMPTYVDKHGRVQEGMQDQNGRLQSGLKALVSGLATMGTIRNEQDLFAGLSGAIGRGVAGTIMPEWDEWMDREREKQRLEHEAQTAEKAFGWQSQMMTAEVGRQTRQQQQQRADKSLDDRIARHKVQNLKDEQKSVLDPIFKRGYYYEGDNPDEDARLAASNVVLPDFDNTRKPIVENGVRKAWDPVTKSYKQMEGTEVDPDDVPMTFMIDGQKVTASTRQFVGYAGAKERQKSQQTFQATENDKNRQVQYERIKQAAAMFKAKTPLEYASRILAVKKAKEAGDLSDGEYNELMQILQGNNADYKDLPQQQ